MFLNGFLNIKLKRTSLSAEILLKINRLQTNYGNFPNQNQITVIDYSSPNIAKTFLKYYLICSHCYWKRSKIFIKN
ncbi:hypothetical protein ACEW7V_01510 [Areca yellow leaf disease phytoplasma]|uniref:hypothetical protein n=1 Tax=Areca yellow leaf disease phytoplasma TaxID=927614 RepID=UPI0035B51618